MIIGGLVTWFVGSAGLALVLGKTVENLQAREKAMIGEPHGRDTSSLAMPS